MPASLFFEQGGDGNPSQKSDAQYDCEEGSMPLITVRGQLILHFKHRQNRKSAAYRPENKISEYKRGKQFIF